MVAAFMQKKRKGLTRRFESFRKSEATAASFARHNSNSRDVKLCCKVRLSYYGVKAYP